ncbi:hypothetical protein PYK79_25195 [Streptomyces sp. ID05-04B]|nr:hypothetical protein [Streptomyces sp. ID05-04B]MDX5565933.1 hypothetical protein [Streptomyces sp. ID05-04B]
MPGSPYLQRALASLAPACLHIGHGADELLHTRRKLRRPRCSSSVPART